MPEPTTINADQPLVLLPVRLETRFFGSELWIRVYPDTVHIDTHEPELTHDELQWGRHFHEELWRASGDDARRKAAWKQLAERFGASRAGWVGLQLTPLNDSDKPPTTLPPGAPLAPPPRFPDVPVRPLEQSNETWTRAPWSRLLPDRWFAAAFESVQNRGRLPGGRNLTQPVENQCGSAILAGLPATGGHHAFDHRSAYR